MRTQVLAMGGLVDQQLSNALTALAEDDIDLAQRVVDTDHAVNKYEVEIDEECTRIIALRSPAASDLRLAITVIKTITDLERMGDEAGRVAKMVLRPDNAGLESAFVDELQHMGRQVRSMLDQSLDAFARNDAALAYQTTEKDSEVDDRYQRLTTRLVDRMAEEPGSIPSCICALWAARALERIGDRSRNICEYVIYLVGGKDVRHTSPETMKSAAEKAAADQAIPVTKVKGDT